MDEKRCALVLSGGSIKGVFQADAIEFVLEHGRVPTGIHGVSVGALNGSFLADRAGRAVRDGRVVDWPAIGRELSVLYRFLAPAPTSTRSVLGPGGESERDDRTYLRLFRHMSNFMCRPNLIVYLDLPPRDLAEAGPPAATRRRVRGSRSTTSERSIASTRASSPTFFGRSL